MAALFTSAIGLWSVRPGKKHVASSRVGGWGSGVKEREAVGGRVVVSDDGSCGHRRGAVVDVTPAAHGSLRCGMQPCRPVNGGREDAALACAFGW